MKARRNTGLAAVFLAQAALSAACDPAAAQWTDFRLDLGIVARSGMGSAGSPLMDLPGNFINANPGQTVRLELRYRITDLNNSDTLTARGLSHSLISISRSGPAGAGIARRADLTTDQSGDNSPQPQSGAVNPDSSGLFNPGGVTGMINEFRGGLASGDDDHLRNGDPRNPLTNELLGTTFTIEPMAISAGAVNNQRSNTAPGTQMWGAYAWTFTPSAAFVGDVTFTAVALADAFGNRYYFYPTPLDFPPPGPGDVGSPMAQDATFTIHVVPAPTTGALLCTFLIVARARRRRSH